MNLRDQIKRDEGSKPYAYTDSLGYLTIGVGRLIDGRKGGGLSTEEIDYLLENDIKKAKQAVANEFPWALLMKQERFDVLVNMAFNLGIGGLKGFTNALEAMKVNDWELAAQEMLDSRWASQVGERAHRLAKQMIYGEYQ